VKYFAIRASETDWTVPNQYVASRGRPVQWTRDVDDAVQFGTATAAMNFAGLRGISAAVLVEVSHEVVVREI